ncbi:hypothetical protein CAOG_07661 [Capsaspora owczarzaki ATCC 30864]|uniref:Rgp1-domain-containing protein n=1 Tax=Capsaspora owczarzaki (strain ATCC 30864) TaxID=595528 RepID=A0A0D2WX03_CAPO3|nr:hypothetical protein CAOG_07661 [Capsaspora owczarzaki ATCC 30864]KJE97218.1 hypothetical protein CAOG_007661 [Capsaspora owczarzaki ATCC 30864]|eukprot:XP_004343535.2 hypothetical protein CAOG_07661 [Capsaspora owczarzaki ATCC 30864]
MLDVRVTLARNGVFFAGETVHATIALTNLNSSAKPTDASTTGTTGTSTSGVEKIAWVSAQVTCHARLNAAYTNADAVANNPQRHPHARDAEVMTDDAAPIAAVQLAMKQLSAPSTATPAIESHHHQDGQHHRHDHSSHHDVHPDAQQGPGVQSTASSLLSFFSSFLPGGLVSEPSTPNSHPPSQQTVSPNHSHTAHSGRASRHRGDDSNGVLMFSSPLVILTNNTLLEAGQAQSFEYMAPLPLDIPPSHRGVSAGYTYRINVGVQLGNADPVSLPVSFRVFVIQPVEMLTSTLAALHLDRDSERKRSISRQSPLPQQDGAKRGLGEESRQALTRRSFPSLPEPAGGPSRSELWDSDTIFELLSLVTANVSTRQGASKFNITSSIGHVARFKLRKPAYRLGEDVVGTFDFSDATIPCYQIAIHLECIETVGLPYAVNPQKLSTTRLHAEHHEFCAHTKQLHVALPVPQASTPDFDTDLLSVKWRLRIEFAIASRVDQGKPILPDCEPLLDSNETWVSPTQIQAELLSMTIPLVVIAAHPLHVHSPALVTAALLKHE